MDITTYSDLLKEKCKIKEMKTKTELLNELIDECNREKAEALKYDRFETAGKCRDEHKEMVKTFAEKLGFKIYFLPELQYRKTEGGTIVDGIYIPDNDM